MELKPGRELQDGKYIIEEKIGAGGFGITYKGIWKMEVPNPLGKTVVEYPVAIKEFFFEEYCSRNDETDEVLTKSEKGQELFVRFKDKLIKEASILLKLDHPNIVNVSEVFEENNTAYMVMEFIEGGNLKDIISHRNSLTMNDAIRYIKQVAEALQYIHGHNIIHLDVKPANILLDKAGNAKLIDFGIAKQYTDTGLQTQAATVATFSKGYSPIEQYAVNRKEKYGAYTDIYALGATLYHCLTGEMPTESASRLSEELVPPSRFNPDIPVHVEKTILKAMELKYKDRFSTVSEFLEALNEEKIDSEAGESPTKVASLPPDFKELDTKYITEPSTDIKPVQGKKTVISSSDLEQEKNEEKKGEKKESQFSKDKLKVLGMTSVAILILVTGVVSFFIFSEKSVSPQVVEEQGKTDTVSVPNKEIQEEQIPSEEEQIPFEEAVPEKTSVETKKEKSTPSATKTNVNVSAKSEPSAVVEKAFKKALNIKGNQYYGDVKNGKPNGNGRLTFTAYERISDNDMEKTMSEPGDYLDGKWNDGELERGVLYDSLGNRKAVIIIGKF